MELTRFDITHPALPLGDPPDPADPLQRAAHQRAVTDIDRYLHPPERTRSRSMGRGISR